MSEKCELSPDGEHHYKMLKSGLHPIYSCIYCFKNRPKSIICPACGHLIEVDDGYYTRG